MADSTQQSPQVQASGLPAIPAVLRKWMPIIVAIFTLSIGGFFLTHTAAGHTPDVWTHTYRISSVLNGDIIAHPVDSKSYFHNSAGNVGGAVDRQWLDYSLQHHDGYDPGIAIPDTITRQTVNTVDLPFNNTAINSPVAYTPQLLGFTIGKLTDASANSTFMLTQVLTLCTYAACMAIGIAALPKWRIASGLVVLSPLLLRYNSFAVSADSFTQAMALLFTCLLVRSIYTRISTRYSVGIACVAVILSMCKFIYAPLVLLLLFIPWAQRNMEIQAQPSGTVPNSRLVTTLDTSLTTGGKMSEPVPPRRLLIMNAGVNMLVFSWLGLWITLNQGYTTTPMMVSLAESEHRTYELFHSPNTVWKAATSIMYAIVTGQSNLNRSLDSFIILSFWAAFAILLILLIAVSLHNTLPKTELLFWQASYLLTAAIIVLIYLALWLKYTPSSTIGVDGMQPRYLYPLVLLCTISGLTCLKAIFRRTAQAIRRLRIH